MIDTKQRYSYASRHVLQYLSVLSIAFSLPLFIFIFSYFGLLISLSTISLLIIAYVHIWKYELSKTINDIVSPPQRYTLGLSILLALILGVLSGASRLFSTARNWDWIKHDVILHDLVNYDWPVVYSVTDQAIDVLVYNISYYLIPALFEKYLAIDSHIALLIETIVLLFLLFRTLTLFVPRYSIFFLVTLIFFDVPDLGFTSLESLLVLTMVPTHHAIAILFSFILLIYCHQTKKLGVAVIAIPSIFMYSPVTAFVFGLILFFIWIFEHHCRGREVYFYGVVSVVVLAILSFWFSGAASNFFGIHSDPITPIIFLPLICSIILINKDYRKLTMAVIATAFIISQLAIGLHELQRIGGSLIILIFIYVLLNSLRGSHLFNVSIFSSLILCNFWGAYHAYASTRSPFYGPSSRAEGPLSVTSAVSRLPYAQYIKSIEPSSWLLFPDITSKTLSTNLLYENNISRKVLLNREQNAANIYEYSLDAGIYKLILDVYADDEAGKVGFSLISDLDTSPILMMPNHNLMPYSSYKLNSGSQIQLPVYFKVEKNIN